MSNEKHPETWLSLVESRGHGLIEDEVLSSLEQANECLLMGLRLEEGLDAVRAETLAGQPLDQETLHRLMEEGLIETVSNHHLRVTTKGRPVLNAIVRTLSF